MAPQLPTDESWPTGDAFAAVLREISEHWQLETRRMEVDGDFRFLLIEQWSSRDGSGMVSGEVAAAWIANAERLQRIDDAEHAAHVRHLRATRPTIYPFVYIQFWVSANGQQACFGFRHSSRGGLGGDWLVDRDAVGPLLIPDPDGGQWIS